MSLSKAACVAFWPRFPRFPKAERITRLKWNDNTPIHILMKHNQAYSKTVANEGDRDRERERERERGGGDE